MSKYVVDYPAYMVITIKWSVTDLYDEGIALQRATESIEIKGESDEIVAALKPIIQEPIEIYDNSGVGHYGDEFWFGFDNNNIPRQYSQKYATRLDAQKSARRFKDAAKRLLKQMERFEE